MSNIVTKASFNPGYPKHGRAFNPMDDDISKISDEPVDSCYVVFTTVETRRNVQGVKFRGDGRKQIGGCPLMIQNSAGEKVVVSCFKDFFCLRKSN